jgi:hypothetical protein
MVQGMVMLLVVWWVAGQAIYRLAEWLTGN